MEEIFTIKNILIYYIVLNLVGFAVMYIDKQKAKKGKWRIPENTIFIITVLGGGIGTIAGMYKFRHKTKKWTFTFGLPVLFVLNILALIYLIVHIICYKNWQEYNIQFINKTIVNKIWTNNVYL